MKVLDHIQSPDTYDTLVSRRLYKPALPHEQAVAQIREGRGVLFDPDIVDAFLDIADEIQVIAARFADSYEDLQRELDRLEMAIVEDRIVLGGDS